MDMDAANNERDRRLRFRLLRLLNQARTSTMAIRGHVVRDMIANLPGGDEFEGDAHVIGLLRDLQNGGYIEVEDKRTRRTERYGLSFLDCRVTARGTRFIAGGEPPDALIDDDRIVKER